MKKIIILLSVILFSATAMAQRFDASVWAGANFSQLDGDDAGHYNHIGIHGAVNTTFALGQDEQSDLRMLVELAFTQKGSYVNNIDRSISLSYIEIPLMLTYSFGNLRIGGGIAPGILVNAKVTDGEVLNNEMSDNFRRMDALPLTADISWSKGHFIASVRYENSMLSVVKEARVGTYRIFRSNKGNFSRLFSFGIGYRF